MKRFPECRRDYYDDTLLYCLDDGNALLEGPATNSSGDEPATAIRDYYDDPLLYCLNDGNARLEGPSDHCEPYGKGLITSRWRSVKDISKRLLPYDFRQELEPK